MNIRAIAGKVSKLLTNVLLCAASTDPKERSKRTTTLAILDEDDLASSVQVLQEFYVQSTKSTLKRRLSHEQARLLIESFFRFPVQEIDLSIVQAALAAKERFRISYWDAAIVEAARALGCPIVLSEDLNHGQDYGGVKVVDPFRSTASVRQ